ncbi:hypothetical protein ACROYT_G003453 [Oculina patagonica]
MTLSIVEEVQVLIRQWKVTSINGLSGSLIAVFALAVLFEFMSSYHSYLDPLSASRYATREPSRIRRIQEHLLRTGSYLLTAIAGYLLMMVVHTRNVWLFASIVAGLGFGYFLSNPLYTWYRSREFGNVERIHEQRKAEKKQLLQK